MKRDYLVAEDKKSGNKTYETGYQGKGTIRARAQHVPHIDPKENHVYNLQSLTKSPRTRLAHPSLL